ncbi:WecB/TagA/CpsF family glycosyltransferase [Leptolyngbya boryana CZ1]|jgi:N-acetylglucosaminyldiphosphoundecaprenol N-acetyl-beta-D-mannosaminyltransferase|uniref:Bacterial polymer biosynthesis protein, WecB/TagA/CpsF family n=2 Tax=Leptolyngbya boryana TaxID=1184 RepID=A0A1Z4JLY8_LEPBY|nr:MULTISPECIES: WecB/TagA/CpsF family glycosyltransferase [Leptolyngbya]BAY57658.1 bacterial polymer biosynthesis protein, WecB/TagA/CpsF family [Leptolyngbya boryana NIES-2135]MBD2367612.1 WecB/TagA/CpsF family glycosyltransferase [Leptolyngbya sp. FACHB-161]MBD2374136.1 WecB/TagA/CpsF family glycosyltransferase [Leptolyngbya sp. FACHB-238]MBD2398761.1 WecB/TagA/CpsF family glycosyltransferase [Leptolyngbya sp. FACHB-239]MBD2404985.1 WecB/TagA/CpsF family glycosyltransferase [Leptolyngbya sp
MTQTNPKGVSRDEVQKLYRDFRKSVLISTAQQITRENRAQIRQKVEILDVEIDNISKAELLNRLTRGVIFTPNVDHLMKLQTDPEFKQAYEVADYKICDSQIVLYASKFLGSPLQAKISGSELFPTFCEHHKDNPNITIFLLGGAEGVAKQAQVRINAKIGRDIIVAAHSPSFGFEKDEVECQAIVELINRSAATVLVIGVGAPKQEIWIAKYKDQLPNIDIFMAVGASIDFEAGVKPRAPEWVSDRGLEWFYRLMSEPKRLWKRYLIDDLPFFWLLLQQKLKRLR